MEVTKKIIISIIFIIYITVLPCLASGQNAYDLLEEAKQNIDKNEMVEARKKINYIFRKKIKYLYVNAYDLRGQINYKEGKYKTAIKDYTKALNINPKDYTAYVGLGDIYLDLKNYDLAMKNYIYSIEIASTYDAYNGKGYIKLSYLNDIGGAIDDLTKAININPKREEAYINRGFAYYSNKNYKKAVIDFNQAKKLSSENPETYYYCAMCNMKLNSNKSVIINDLRKAKSLYIKSKNTDRISECYNLLLKMELNK